MPRYLLATHAPSDAPPMPEMTPEEMDAAMAPMRELEQDLHDSGAWVFSARLDTPRSARVARDDDGAPLLTDGPYLDTKEQVAGFYLLDAADDDAAAAWAARVAACTGRPIELRQLAAWED